ncbi:hypothetical protein N8607_00150 [bacterium]|nr:hypothetical protein [bacterium]MDA8959625.1 hypothetical protein [bacterium]MDB2575585.1 hypothetical protein [Planctomycetota bacterium]MDC1043695.1 hypothetical protein [bacterium]
MKNALNYITYGICGAAIMGASFIGYIVISGTPVQDLKGVGPLFAGNVQAEVEPEVTPEEITARDERAADSRGNRQVFADAGVALSAFSLPSPFSVAELDDLEKRLTTKLSALEAREGDLEQREAEVERTRNHLADLEVALEQQRSALLAQSDNNEARGAELDNKSGQVTAGTTELKADRQAFLTEKAQLYADNKAEDAARMLVKAEAPIGAAEVLVLLDAARRTELLEQIEIQLPDEFKAYYDAFNQVLAARTAANAR